MVGDAYDRRGPYIVIGIRSGSLPAPGRFGGFRVMFERSDIVVHHSPPLPQVGTVEKVGFWYNENKPHFPKAQDAVDRSWSPAERRAVLGYMQKVPRGQQYRGWSECRICGKHNGSCDMTDGVYTWPEGFAHYITEHGVRPPREFVDHCLRKRSLGSFWSDPFGTIISGPGKIIDAAAGGPQQRARAHAAIAAAQKTQAQIDAEKASRDAAVAASQAQAQAEVDATTAAAKAAAKKKLTKTLAIGGSVFAVLAVALVLVTGKSS